MLQLSVMLKIMKILHQNVVATNIIAQQSDFSRQRSNTQPLVAQNPSSAASIPTFLYQLLVIRQALLHPPDSY